MGGFHLFVDLLIFVETFKTNQLHVSGSPEVSNIDSPHRFSSPYMVSDHILDEYMSFYYESLNLSGGVGGQAHPRTSHPIDELMFVIPFFPTTSFGVSVCFPLRSIVVVEHKSCTTSLPPPHFCQSRLVVI